MFVPVRYVVPLVLFAAALLTFVAMFAVVRPLVLDTVEWVETVRHSELFERSRDAVVDKALGVLHSQIAAYSTVEVAQSSNTSISSNNTTITQGVIEDSSGSSRDYYRRLVWSFAYFASECLSSIALQKDGARLLREHHSPLGADVSPLCAELFFAEGSWTSGELRSLLTPLIVLRQFNELNELYNCSTLGDGEYMDFKSAETPDGYTFARAASALVCYKVDGTMSVSSHSSADGNTTKGKGSRGLLVHRQLDMTETGAPIAFYALVVPNVSLVMLRNVSTGITLADHLAALMDLDNGEMFSPAALRVFLGSDDGPMKQLLLYNMSAVDGSSSPVTKVSVEHSNDFLFWAAPIFLTMVVLFVCLPFWLVIFVSMSRAGADEDDPSWWNHWLLDLFVLREVDRDILGHGNTVSQLVDPEQEEGGEEGEEMRSSVYAVEKEDAPSRYTTVREDTPNEGVDDLEGSDAPERSTVANADDVRFSCGVTVEGATIVVFRSNVFKEISSLLDHHNEALENVTRNVITNAAAIIRADFKADPKSVHFFWQADYSLVIAVTGPRQRQGGLKLALKLRKFLQSAVKEDIRFCGIIATAREVIFAVHGNENQTESIVGDEVTFAWRLAALGLTISSEVCPLIAYTDSKSISTILLNVKAIPIEKVKLTFRSDQLDGPDLFQKENSGGKNSQGYSTVQLFEVFDSEHSDDSDRSEEYEISQKLQNSLDALSGSSPKIAEKVCALTCRQLRTYLETADAPKRSVEAALKHAERLWELAKELEHSPSWSQLSYPRNYIAWEQFYPGEFEANEQKPVQQSKGGNSSGTDPTNFASPIQAKLNDGDRLMEALQGVLERKRHREAERQRRLTERLKRKEEEEAKRQEEGDDEEGGFTLFNFVTLPADEEEEKEEHDTDILREEPAEFTDLNGKVWMKSKRVLGKGAYGNVLLGMGPDGGMAAIKGIPVMDVEERDILNVVKEVALLARLKHENIVEYIGGAIVQSSYLMIVMEAMGGGSLYSVLCQYGQLPQRWIQRYLRDILSGLRYLHSNGMMHRDIKPHNILLGADGRCKLADFFTVARVDCGEEVPLGGTVLYMAPEAARGRPCTASDIWSVGVTAAHLVTGRVPWHSVDASMPHSVLHRLGRDPTCVPALDDVPEGLLRGMIVQCLATDPTKRPSADFLLKGCPFLIETPE